MQQSQNQQLYWQVNKINQLKQCFETDHSQRSDTAASRRRNGLKSVAIATTLLQSQELNLVSQDITSVPGEINRVRGGARKDIESLNGDFTVYQKDRMSPILTSIDIKMESREHLLRKGGYSSLLLGIYQYIPQLSIN